MGADVGIFERVNWEKIDWNSAKLEAIERCKAWEYDSATEFPSTRKKCLGIGRICITTKVSKTYQCTTNAPDQG